MGKQTQRVAAVMGAALLMVFVVGAVPALAQASTVTEDNDSNDGGTANNVSDSGDNAHPSGRDRSVENGGSGNQGNSSSDPDGDSNGGADKAGGSGGIDKADQDGNNGCGNDDDFEDDNNGNCGGKGKTKNGPCVEIRGKGKGHAKKCDSVLTNLTPKVCVANVQMSEHANVCDKKESGIDTGFVVDTDLEDDDEVLGTALSSDAVAGPDDEVLGTRQSNGSFLPFTGVGITLFFAIGGLLVATGLIFMRAKRADHS